MRKALLILLFAMASAASLAQISVGTNFRVTGALPIDTRFVFEDTTARNLLFSEERYVGLICYTRADSSNWQLINGTENKNWRALRADDKQVTSWSKRVDADMETGWTMPFKIRAETVVMYNGSALHTNEWSGIGTKNLVINFDANKFDYIVVIY